MTIERPHECVHNYKNPYYSQIGPERKNKKQANNKRQFQADTKYYFSPMGIHKTLKQPILKETKKKELTDTLWEDSISRPLQSTYNIILENFNSSHELYFSITHKHLTMKKNYSDYTFNGSW
jgi:hypothetical protein